MAIMQLKVGNEKLIELGLEGLLTDEKIMKAIDSSDKNALRELIFDVANTLASNSIELEKFYYGEYIVLSDELFDMFTVSCLEEIFELFGYETRLEKHVDVDSNLWIGDMKISNENIEVSIFAEESMHDSLISIFANTKVAKYTIK